MVKKLLLAAALCIASSTAWAQNPTCPTRPAGDSSNACASTAFVNSAVTTPAVVPVSGDTTINSTMCGKTLSATGAFNTYTLSSPLAEGCLITLTNASTSRAQKLSGFPSELSTRLWPTQTVQVQVQGGTWKTTRNPGLWLLTAPIACNVDPINGNNGNDCLATGTGNAVQTLNGAMSIIAQQWYVAQDVTILSAASQTYTDAGFLAQRYVGNACVQIDGNSSTNAITAAGFANLAWAFVPGGCWSIRRWTLTNAATGGIGVYAQTSARVQMLDGMTFGSFTNAEMIVAAGSWFTCQNDFTVTGSARAMLDATDYSKLDCTIPTVTLTGTPNFSTATVIAHGSGAVVGTPHAWSGSATGTRCNANLMGLIDSGGTFASIPGNSPCLASSGGYIN